MMTTILDNSIYLCGYIVFGLLVVLCVGALALIAWDEISFIFRK